jgi:hypothetical protein
MEEIEKSKFAKPKVVLTEEQIIQVEELAGRLTYNQIADYFGVHQDTFNEIKNRQPAVARAYKKGKANAIDGVVKTLMDKCREGDTAAIIFFLKTQAGWSTSDNKNYIKGKLNISKDKSPLEIIEAVLIALEEGNITVQDATQIASLATQKANLKSNISSDNSNDHLESRESLMEKIKAIQEVIKYAKANENTK